jgi:hypothetical protein
MENVGSTIYSLPWKGSIPVGFPTGRLRQHGGNTRSRRRKLGETFSNVINFVLKETTHEVPHLP